MTVNTDRVLRCILGEPSPIICREGGLDFAGWSIRLHYGDTVLSVLQEGWPFVRPEVLARLADMAHICQPSDCPHRCAWWSWNQIQEYPHSVVFLDEE